MRKLLHIFIVPLLMTWSHEYSVELDDQPKGVIYKPFREIYLKNDSISLNYFIDTSILNQIISNKSYFKICNQTKLAINITNTKRQIGSSPNVKLIELKLNSTEQLKLFYNETILGRSTKYCINIKDNLFIFNMTAQQIKNFNVDIILNAISIEKFTNDLKNLTSNLNENTLPFRFDKHKIYVSANEQLC